MVASGRSHCHRRRSSGRYCSLTKAVRQDVTDALAYEYGRRPSEHTSVENHHAGRSPIFRMRAR